MPRNEFTPEQREQIESLPRRKFMVGSTLKVGYYDEDNRLIYMVDESGNLTGQVGRVQVPDEKSAETPEQHRKDKTSDVGRDPDSSGGNSDPPDKRHATIGKVITYVGILAAIIVIGVGTFFYVGQRSTAVAMPTPTPYIAPTQEPTPSADDSEDNATVPAAGVVTVIQTTRDVLKGQQIDADALEPAEITTQEYNQLTALGSTPNKWEDLTTVNGLYAASFIPAGNYINNTNLSTSDPNPPNPWGTETDGYDVLRVGLSSLTSECVPFYGAIGTLCVSKIIDTTSDTAEPAPDLTWPEDSQETSPYLNIEYVDTPLDETHITRTFYIYDAVVADILNGADASLYKAYLPYIDMPAVNRISAISSLCKTGENASALTVATLVVRVTTSEFTALGDISNASLTLSLTGGADTETDAKYTVSWGTQTVAQTVSAELANLALYGDAPEHDSTQNSTLDFPPDETAALGIDPELLP